MRTSLSSSGYTVRQAAWLLGVEQDTVHRAIRVGTLRLVRRRGRYVLPAAQVVRLLSAGAP
ncbi:excisionase family DNA-binding protein [Actinosynnema sp. CA-248983]